MSLLWAAWAWGSLAFGAPFTVEPTVVVQRRYTGWAPSSVADRWYMPDNLGEVELKPVVEPAWYTSLNVGLTVMDRFHLATAVETDEDFKRLQRLLLEVGFDDVRLLYEAGPRLGRMNLDVSFEDDAAPFSLPGVDDVPDRFEGKYRQIAFGPQQVPGIFMGMTWIRYDRPLLYTTDAAAIPVIADPASVIELYGVWIDVDLLERALTDDEVAFERNDFPALCRMVGKHRVAFGIDTGTGMGLMRRHPNYKLDEELREASGGQRADLRSAFGVGLVSGFGLAAAGALDIGGRRFGVGVGVEYRLLIMASPYVDPDNDRRAGTYVPTRKDASYGSALLDGFAGPWIAVGTGF